MDKLSALLSLLIMQQTVADTEDEASERERERERPGGKREWLDITSVRPPDRVTVTSKSWGNFGTGLHRNPTTQKEGRERQTDRSSQSSRQEWQ